MADKYNLQPNEVVLLKDESVTHVGFGLAYSAELLLTNLNLVLVKKTMFGKTKGVLTFPLNQIKVFNKRAQALIARSSNGSDLLEVYFLNGQEKFAFQSGGKRKINEWISKINQAATGEDIPSDESSGLAIPGVELVAGVLKDSLNVFKSKLGYKTETPSKVAGKCLGCGAPVSGFSGQTVTCEYCNSAHQL
ncbi:MAG: hypothetical protein WBA28_09930 [Microbacteriaceae bacterium]